MQALSAPLERRRLLLAAGAAPLVACASKDSGTPGGAGGGPAAKPVCNVDAKGPGLDYCLVEKRELRVPGAGTLAVNRVLLVNLDDGTAAIIARDAKGLYALSGICTHQCCIVSLCSNGDCSMLETNPGNCAVTPTAPLIGGGGAAFLCPCHGSAFTADGVPISGPATSRLPSVAMRRDGDDIIVDMSTPASPGARVA